MRTFLRILTVGLMCSLVFVAGFCVGPLSGVVLGEALLGDDDGEDLDLDGDEL